MVTASRWTSAPAGPPACTTSRMGVPRFQRAAAVAIAGYSIETPRLLLNSASRRFPDGLCNDFDQVGRYLMVQGAPQTAGRLRRRGPDVQVAPARGEQRGVLRDRPGQAYTARGFSIQTVSPLPITWAEHVAAQGHWGRALREYMSDYVHWSCLGALCEFLPLPGQPGHAGGGEGPARPAGRAFLLLPVRQRPAAHAGRAVRDGGSCCARQALTRSSPSTATPTWSAAPGWPLTNSTASWTLTAAVSRCPISTSPTAACCPRRAAPTRR